MAEQANKALFALLKKSKALGLPFDIQIDLFDKTVKPIFLYGAELWGYRNCDSFERIHLKFLKYLFKGFWQFVHYMPNFLKTRIPF